MLTLLAATLPSLRAQYATEAVLNQHTGTRSVRQLEMNCFLQRSAMMTDTEPVSTSDTSPKNSLPTSADVSSTIAEQIRQFLSSDIVR